MEGRMAEGERKEGGKEREWYDPHSKALSIYSKKVS